jgi:hypothetical protein
VGWLAVQLSGSRNPRLPWGEGEGETVGSDWVGDVVRAELAPTPSLCPVGPQPATTKAAIINATDRKRICPI